MSKKARSWFIGNFRLAYRGGFFFFFFTVCACTQLEAPAPCVCQTLTQRHQRTDAGAHKLQSQFFTIMHYYWTISVQIFTLWCGWPFPNLHTRRNIHVCHIDYFLFGPKLLVWFRKLNAACDMLFKQYNFENLGSDQGIKKFSGQKAPVEVKLQVIGV